VCYHISTGLYQTDSKYLVSNITKQINYVLFKLRLCRIRVTIVAVETQQCTLRVLELLLLLTVTQQCFYGKFMSPATMKVLQVFI